MKRTLVLSGDGPDDLAQVQGYAGAFELPEPDSDIRVTIQPIADNEAKHVPCASVP
jgi:hypothetical protein